MFIALVLWVAIAATGFVLARSRNRPPGATNSRVSKEALIRVHYLMAQNSPAAAVQVVRDDTGWDRERCEAFVGRMATGRFEGFLPPGV